MVTAVVTSHVVASRRAPSWACMPSIMPVILASTRLVRIVDSS